MTLQRQAVRLASQTERYQSALAAYEALLAGGCGSEAGPDSEPRMPSTESLSGDELNEGLADLTVRIGRLDWPDVEQRLTGQGLALVPKLLDGDECQTLRAMFGEDRLFAKTVTMNKSRFGKGVYRYFAAPIPPLVDAIRHAIYPHLAEIVNRWQRLLNREQFYPAAWSEFRGRCRAAGQTVPSPLLLRYDAGGFNALHQDLRGEVYFAVQLVVVLSPRNSSPAGDESSFTGGEFLFCDQPERKASDCRAVPAGIGDAVLFCTRERLARVGGVYGLQPVQHGLNQVASGTRYAMGVPFHEFR